MLMLYLLHFLDLKQSFDTVKNQRSEDSYENKSSLKSSSLSPSTSYSTETLQSGIIRKQRRRSLPQAPSTETEQVIRNWKTNYGSIDRKMLAKPPDRYSNVRSKAASDLYRNYSMDSNGVIYRNKRVEPDLQSTADGVNPKYQAFPDLVLHQYKRRIVEFTEGSKKLPSKPYEDLWNKIHLNKDRLKHSIPGHCTILDRSETSNDDSLSVSSGNFAGKQQHRENQSRIQARLGSVPNRGPNHKPIGNCNMYVENKWQTQNNKDLGKPVIRVEPPTPTPSCDMKVMQRRLVKASPTDQPNTRTTGNKLNRSCSFNDHNFEPRIRPSRSHYKSDLDLVNPKSIPHDHHVRPIKMPANGYHDSRRLNKTLQNFDKSRKHPGGQINGVVSGLYKYTGRTKDHTTRALCGYNPTVASSKGRPYSSMIELDAAESDGSYI